MSGGLVQFTDPLLELLKDPNLNKEKEKSQKLVKYIDEIEDKKIKSWCIEAFEILRDLEKIEVKINNWEFQTLDFNISVDSVMTNEQDVKRRKFNLEVAKRVAKHCLDFHKILGDLGGEIDELSIFSKKLSPVQKISDPGTILTELNLRVIKLQNVLADQISIHYSRARLVNIGMSMGELVENDDSKSPKSAINDATIKNYKKFVNKLLQQLNGSVRSGDTIGAMECIAIVNDVEKMFVTMKAQREQQKQKKLMDERRERQENMANRQKLRESALQAELEKERKKRYQQQWEQEQREQWKKQQEEQERKIKKEKREKKEQERRKKKLEEERLQKERLQKEKLAKEEVAKEKSTEKIPPVLEGLAESSPVSSPKKAKSSQIPSPPPSTAVDVSDNESIDSESSGSSMEYSDAMEVSNADSTAMTFNVDGRRRHRLNNDKMPVDLHDSILHKTTLSEKMPEMLAAFEEAKAAQTGLKKVVTKKYDESRDSFETPETSAIDESEPDEEKSVEVKKVEVAAHPQLPKPSILRAFFQPVIRQPIYIGKAAEKKAEETKAEEAAKKRKYMRQLTGSDVQRRLLKYQQDEQLGNLTLSTKKLTSIEVGRGRVKETVKEIEQQLPKKVSAPSSPKKLEAPSSPKESGSTMSKKPLVFGPAAPVPAFDLPFTDTFGETSLNETSSIEDSVD